jgi:RHS repeat-associated protein
VSKVHYVKPFGGDRFPDEITETTMHYTGQHEEESLGIYFYNARWYDPILGRFLQADSIVPNPWNPASFDRYAYARNSPVRWT